MVEVAEQTSAEPIAESPVSTEFDGTLGEGWMEKYGVPEDMRGDLTLKSTKSVAALASQTVNAQKMIGKNANMVIVPNEKSTASEWEEFHKASGRPDTPDDYQITHLEGVGEVDAELEAAFKNIAHSEGLRPSTVKKLVELDDNRVLAIQQAMERAEDQRRVDAENAFKEKMGIAYEERKLWANRLLEENVTDKAHKEALLDEVGNSPAMAELLSNIYKKSFDEHKVISADVTQPTPMEAISKAEELRNTPGYITGELRKTSPARYNQITEEIKTLYQKVYPEKGR